MVFFMEQMLSNLRRKMSLMDGKTPVSTSCNSQVLVIEEDEDSRYLLKLFLEMKGYRTLTARNIEQFFAQPSKTIPDLIIMNIGLPISKGLTALRCLGDYSFFNNVPILVTSAYATPLFQAEVLNAGAKCFLAKPINLDYLEALVKQSLTH